MNEKATFECPEGHAGIVIEGSDIWGLSSVTCCECGQSMEVVEFDGLGKTSAEEYQNYLYPTSQQ